MPQPNKKDWTALFFRCRDARQAAMHAGLDLGKAIATWSACLLELQAAEDELYHSPEDEETVDLAELAKLAP